MNCVVSLPSGALPAGRTAEGRAGAVSSRLGVVVLSDGLLLPYAERGDADGRPVLLLHGYIGSWRSFQGVMRHFPRSIRAVAPTQRGHGDAGRPAIVLGISRATWPVSWMHAGFTRR